MADDLRSFAVAMNEAARSLTGPQLTDVMTKVGVALKPLGRDAASRDLGSDAKFSGWPKAALEVAFSPHRQPGGITFHRAGRSAGPWRVAEFGRNQGDASGFAGPGVNRRTGETLRTASGGVRRVRGARSRKWNGRTRGKGTWSEAERLIGSRAPAVVDREVTAFVFRVVAGGR